MHTAMPSVCSDVSIYYFLNIPAVSYLLMSNTVYVKKYLVGF